MAKSSGPLHLVLSGLTAKQRALLHELAEGGGYPHCSVGSELERVLHFGNQAAPPVHFSGTAGEDGALVDFLTEHLPASLLAQLRSKFPAGKRPPNASVISQADFVAACSQQVQLEREEDITRATAELQNFSADGAQAAGRSLLRLRCAELSTGLLGKTLLTLVAARGASASGTAPPLPPHKFSPNDVVQLVPAPTGGAEEPGRRGRDGDAAGAGDGAALSGVVYRVTETSLIVAADDVGDSAALGGVLRLNKLANTVTYDRMEEVLAQLSSSTEDFPGKRLLDVAFGSSQPRFQAEVPKLRPALKRGLDSSQKDAVLHALAAHDFALIHGPPGTGKTTAVVAAILQEVANGSRVLCCAASNIAVDNVVARVAAQAPKTRVVRVGHPARLAPDVLERSLEAQARRADDAALAADCRAEAKELHRRLLKLGRGQRAEARAIKGELRKLAKEERQRDEKAVAEVFRLAQVVCCTLSGAVGFHIKGQVFDVVYIDEAAQALEVACWGALVKARRAVLAGDHLQLPPTVLSDSAARAGLSRTLFERLHALHGAAISRMLTVQYRMHESIMAWPSTALYGGQLTAHASVAQHGVQQLFARGGTAVQQQLAAGSGGRWLDDWADGPLVLIDTAGCDMEEARAEEGGSYWNEGEAEVALEVVAAHVAAGVLELELGVITPYAAQQARLRGLLRERSLHNVEVSTVDGFQGREKEVIIISTVRSNSKAEIGFLRDQRRMNVAVSRARRRCVLVCNSDMGGADSFLQSLIDHFEQCGTYVSAMELVAR